MAQHTDRDFERALVELNARIQRMGQLAEEMIAASTRALLERDAVLAWRTIEHDAEMNRLEVEIDDLCVDLLARRQPVASDLRFITTGLKIVTDLERIGDLSVNVCERAVELSHDAAQSIHSDLPRMAEAAGGIVRDALAAFFARDPDAARAVIARDRTVDAFFAQIFRELLTQMTNDPSSVQRATRVQLVAKYLERIADHGTNVAEMVVFMVRGRDIRHGGSEAGGAARPHGVLFLCVHNSARSQMAETWARAVFPPGVRIWSAGSQPASAIAPEAATVMQEAGLAMAAQWPKRISDVPLGDVDTVITLCAEEVCVGLPGQLHRETWTLPDPSAAPPAERLAAFRKVRDDLHVRLQTLAQSWAARPAKSGVS